jgi:hypothetical protein
MFRCRLATYVGANCCDGLSICGRVLFCKLTPAGLHQTVEKLKDREP